MVQRAQRAQSVQAVSSLSADVSSLLIASCPHHITQSEIGSHTLTRLQPSPMSENRNANALPQASPFVTLSLSTTYYVRLAPWPLVATTICLVQGDAVLYTAVVCGTTESGPSALGPLRSP